MVPVSERAPDRPRVLAHRGASHDHAEHTLGAYLAALDYAKDRKQGSSVDNWKDPTAPRVRRLP